MFLIIIISSIIISLVSGCFQKEHSFRILIWRLWWPCVFVLWKWYQQHIIFSMCIAFVFLATGRWGETFFASNVQRDGLGDLTRRHFVVEGGLHGMSRCFSSLLVNHRPYSSCSALRYQGRCQHILPAGLSYNVIRQKEASFCPPYIEE